MPPLISTILSRRSIRKYKPQPIPVEDLGRIMACAQRAPTGGGLQLYTLVRITERNLRDQIAHLAGNQAHVRAAAEFFVVCLDVCRNRALIEQREGRPAHAPVMSVFYGMSDAMIAASYMAAAAEALGYGICFIGGIQNALGEIAQLLKLPQGVLPVVGLCLGAPDEQPEQRPRMPLDALVRQNEYGQLTAEDLERCYTAMVGASASGDWYNTVNRYLGVGGAMETREAVVRQALEQQGFLLGGFGGTASNP